jgi:hypothetical protein
MSEYDAGRLMEQYERDLPPRWKTIACPKCGQPAGASCVRPRLGVPWILEPVTVHVARMRLAGFAAPLPCAVCGHAASSHQRSGGACVSRICGCKAYELPESVR